MTDLELHERLDQKRNEVTRHEPLDARRIAQEHRSHELLALEQLIAELDAAEIRRAEHAEGWGA